MWLAVNADYNAAKNVGLRACGACGPTDDATGESETDVTTLQPAPMSAAGGAPEGVRLNGGTLTADGTYVPDDRPPDSGGSVD